MSTEYRRGVLWALGAAAGIAAFNIPWKLASEHADTAANALVLLAAAAVLNSVLTAFQQRGLPRFSRLDLALGAALACLTLAGNWFSAEAIRLLQPALLTVTQRSEIILVALLAWPVVGERVDLWFWIGAAIAGAGLVVLHDPFSGADAKEVGLAWGLASAACFAGMAVLTRRYIHRIHAASVNALRLWLSVALWFCFELASGEAGAALADLGPRQAAWASLAALFGPFAGRLCMMLSARHLEARITTLTTLAAPPGTLVLAWIFLGDLPGLRDLAGGALILAGIAVPVVARGRWIAAR